MARAGQAGRNDACPCGSGKKHKKCCGLKAQQPAGNRAMLYIVLAIMIGAVIAGVASFRETSYSSGAPGRVWSPEHGHYH